MSTPTMQALADKIRASGVSYLTPDEVATVQAALREAREHDLAADIAKHGINAVDKGDAFTILRALGSEP